MKVRYKKIFVTVSIGALGIMFLSGIGFWVMKNKIDYLQRNAMLASLLGIEINALHKWRVANGLHKDIGFGDSGEEVKIVQESLLSLGFMDKSSKATGFYGPLTFKAVKNFQRANNLPATGIVGPQTRNILNNLYWKTLCPSSTESYPDLIFLDVNKSKGLPKDYIPPNLVSLNDYGIKTLGAICLRKEAAESLKEMFEEAKKEGIILAVTSGFRSYDIQKLLFDYWYKIEGNKALHSIAPPGHSEHQLGTAVDLTGASIHFLGVNQNFANSPEGKWLRANAYKYGFVLSYDDKEDNKDYVFEPWHYRFVGTEIAKMVYEDNITLENYLKVFNEYTVVNSQTR
jgi:LAS superfamily LD-carboxypeptidase LdcB